MKERRGRSWERDGEAARRSEPGREAARAEAPGPRVFLIRHADAKEGTRDPELGMHLSAIGQRQAQALARRMANWQIDAILCSDMHRARETALAVHSFHPKLPLIVDSTFRELSTGTLEAFERGELPQGGLTARLEASWEKIVTLPYRVAALITHNGLIKYLLGKTIKYEGSLKPRFHSAQTGITALQVRSKGRALIQFFNDAHHLTPELVRDKMPWLEDARTGRWHFGLDDPEGRESSDSPRRSSRSVS
jgi:broad specificity phosphatase PhoE